MVRAGRLAEPALLLREEMKSEPTTSTRPKAATVHWWDRWILNSVLVQLTFLLYPAFICGCHFHPIAVPVGLIPVLWGSYTLVTYRDIRECILAYINTLLAIGWLYISWETNIQ